MVLRELIDCVVDDDSVQISVSHALRNTIIMLKLSLQCAQCTQLGTQCLVPFDDWISRFNESIIVFVAVGFKLKRHVKFVVLMMRDCRASLACLGGECTARGRVVALVLLKAIVIHCTTGAQAPAHAADAGRHCRRLECQVCGSSGQSDWPGNVWRHHRGLSLMCLRSPTMC